MLLKEIAVAIERKQDPLFTYPIEKQEAYIKKLGKPADEIERGYFQYRCKMKLYGWPLNWLLNAISLPMALVYLARFERNSIIFDEKAECIYFNNGLPENIVPNSLRERYPGIKTERGSVGCINREDLQFLKKIFKRYPFSWMLWWKVVLKTAWYSAAIKKYAPEAIVCSDEFSFTSSIMTKYCREKGIKLINVMHGEKLYYMRDSFVCYDEYYVWNEHYKNLLIELGAEPNQFRIEVPDSLKISPNSDVQKEFDYTYYLGEEDRQTLLLIASSLGKLKEKGCKISVRPHPRHSDMVEIQRLFSNFHIEDPKKITIENSLQQTRNAMSLYSTVLTQAEYNGINIVIDNISATEKYTKLQQLQYGLFSADHRLLSDILNEE